ncbi:tape measure protein [Corynebacterium amycolatum]
MATNLATAYVEIIPSAKGIGSAISQELSGVEPKATSHGSKIGSKLSAGLKSAMKKGALGAGAAAGATLGRALQKGFGRLNAIEQARAKLSTLADSAADVDAAMDSVTKAVTGTAFATSEAADAAAMAMAAGIKPGREMTGVLSTIADAASFSNKEFSEVAPIFTKAINKGKVMGDTLMQLEENSIPATQALARHLGKTGEEIQEMASKGQISFKDLQEAMDKTIGGQAQAQGETFTGALKNVDAALGRFGETLLATPFKMGPQIFSALGKSIDDVNTKVKAGIEYLQTGVDTEGYMFKAFGTREQADEVMAMLDDVRQNWSEFQSGLRGEDASGLFGALGGSLREIGQAAADIMPALMDVGMSLGEAGMTASIVSITGALGVVAPLLADVLAPILQTVGDLMRENQGVVNALVTAFVGFKTVDAAAGGLAKVASSGGKLQKMFKGLGPAIKGSASGITGFAKVAKSGFLSATRGLKMFQGAFKMGQMGRSLKSVSGAVGKLGLSFGKASVYAKMAGKAITSGLVKGLKLAVGGIKALGMAIAANPIGLLVTAIAAVVAGLVYFFTQTETGKRLWASFMEFMGQVWENIKTWAQAAWDWIVQVWNGIPEWFSEKWNSVTGIVSQA